MTLDRLAVSRTLLGALGLWDLATLAHSVRVGDLALKIGQGLAWSGRPLDDLHAAALLHDIGKLGLSAKTLEKTGPLTEEEWREVRMHPTLGATLLGTFDGLADALPSVRHHHERWDGTGYPEGIRGTNIPPAARIIAVAETFDALTHAWPWRPADSAAAAAEEIERNAGTQFDPAIVAAALRLFFSGLAGFEK